MSRTRIVKGDITKITGGNYKVYSKDEIENIGSKVIQVGKEGGVSYGNNQPPPQIEIKPQKIKFRPSKILPQNNIIAVIEKIENKINDGDIIAIAGNEIKDNWISINGKLYLIPKNISVFGTTFFKVNNELYQPLDLISNCVLVEDYMHSIDEQMKILNEFLNELESTSIKYKRHVKDRLSYDGYFRLAECINEIENKFLESTDYDKIKNWINNRYKD